ncbi:MAG: hydrogenase maturation nickel metallochaperone HypA [Bacillota bacterium]
MDPIHELAMTESLLTIVLKHAEENNAEKVVSVQLQVGELRDIVEEWMQHYFDYLSKGTIAEGAKIMIRTIPVSLRCEKCAHLFSADIRNNDPLCPLCSCKRCEVTGGNEFLIESIGVI